MNNISLVTTKTPLRISLAGGGTDIQDFYKQEHGAVLSASINKYIYVTVKRHNSIFRENYRLNYSDTEHTMDLDEIKNEVARECMRFTKVKPPIYISTIADLPGSSGLGSSSSFAVGLLNALHTFNGERVSAAQLAEEACDIEINRLNHPIGKQDQYAAAFGGLNYMEFHKDGSVAIKHKHLPDKHIEHFFAATQLFWTNVSRQSRVVLEEQKQNVGTRMEELTRMRDLAIDLAREIAEDMDPEKIGRFLNQGWLFKRQLATQISSPQIDEWYDRAIAAGAYGGKLCGAGGGGFLFFVSPTAAKANVRQELADLQEVKVQYESQGSQVIYREQNQ